MMMFVGLDRAPGGMKTCVPASGDEGSVTLTVPPVASMVCWPMTTLDDECDDPPDRPQAGTRVVEAQRMSSL